MKAEEKAKELVYRFKKYSESDWFVAGYAGRISVEEVVLMQAKQCALICVEDMLLELDGFSNDYGYQLSRVDYWKSVKQAIQNL